MTGLLDEARLAGQAGSPRPELYAGIARGWAAGLPDGVARIRAAAPDALPAALHELRSGAVAVGATALAGSLAALEQRAERGDPPTAAELNAALDLAHRSADALAGWWAARGGASP